MQLADFDFDLPRDLVADRPAEPRDSARLLVIPARGEFTGRHIGDLPELLRPGDLLVFNDTKVIPARLVGRRGEATVEITLARDLGGGVWRAYAKGSRRLRPGDHIDFARDLAAEPQHDLAVRCFLDHLGGEIGGEIEPVGRVQPPRAAGIGAPHAAAEIARQGDLDARVATPADQPRRDHPGVVENQQVARPQQIRQLRDMPVEKAAGRRQHQQPRRLARLGRPVGYQLARQIIVEIGETHGAAAPRLIFRAVWRPPGSAPRRC